MAIVYNRTTTGLYTNGCGQLGDSTNFGPYNYTTTSGQLSGPGCFIMNTNTAGSTAFGSELVPVDTSKNYQFAVSAKGISQGNLGFEPGGHLGFACYDENQSFLSLRQQAGIGNTTLTRATNAGDTAIYVADASSWYTGTSSSFTWICFFPSATDPISQGYTTIAPTAYSQSGSAVTDIGGGEWRIDLPLTGSPPTASLPAQYAYPAGTDVCNGRDGGTFNYCHGNPNHPIASGWITYTTSVFTGESRNSSIPFRYGTKYIKFMNLRNYNCRLSGETTRPVYVLDNIIMVERPNGVALPESFLNSDRIR